MDVDTLLTRQMELHTSVRHPPKNAEQLTQLHETMRNYHHFFGKLRSLGSQLHSDPETVFQCFMFISMGGAVSFDKQHQDGSVPMHQAKVLSRTSAIELEPKLRTAVPVKELMVYVGLSKDLRTSLRVKVEDANDIVTAEKSVSQALEYLDFIYTKSAGDPDRMFAFYMVEEAHTLERMLEESAGGFSSPTSLSGTSAGGASVRTGRNGTSAASPLMASLSSGSPAAGATGTESGNGWTLPSALGTEGCGVGGSPTHGASGCSSASLTALPSPLSSLPKALKAQAEIAGNAKGNASQRLRAAQTIVDWLTGAPTEYFADHIEPILLSVGQTLAVLAAEKRSALCRLGCNAISVLMLRLSDEPYLVERGDSHVLTSLLTTWTQTLCKGVFVTVSAISTATDAALREIVQGSHGHPAVVKAVLTSLQNGTQTELRRKCLGYLALSVAAAASWGPVADSGTVPAFSASLVEPVQKYVQTGDSPSRKMARALCAVLRAVSHLTVPISDPKTEKLIQMEKAQILPYIDTPRELERVLFDTNNFVSSMRPGMSASLSASGAGIRPVSSSFRDSSHDGSDERQHQQPGQNSSPVQRGGAAAGFGSHTRRTVLTSASGGISENPMLSYPPKRGSKGHVTTAMGAHAGAAPTTVSAVPLSDAYPSRGSVQRQTASKRPSQLPPFTSVSEDGTVEGAEATASVFETSASLGGADGTIEEEEDEDYPEGIEYAGAAHPRENRRTQPPHAMQMEQPLRERRSVGGSSREGRSSGHPTIPLSLRPVKVTKSPSPRGNRRPSPQRGDVLGRGSSGAAVSPGGGQRTRGDGSRSQVSSGSREGSAAGTTAAALSDSLRRKIEARQLR